MTLREFIVAFALGIAFAAPPGIVTAESIRRGVKGGFWPATLVGLGSLIGDAAYAILALTGLATLLQYAAAQRTIAVAGAGVLIFLAISALGTKAPATAAPEARNEKRNAFLAGALLSLTNPWAITFWVGFGGALLSAGIENPRSRIGLFIAAFLAGSTLWVAILSFLIVAGRRFIDAGLFRALSVASAFVFAATAVYALWRAFV
jgi:chemosensory pili system protein ChpE